MTTVLDLPRWLAAELPDDPRWLETRAMLRSGHADVFGTTGMTPLLAQTDNADHVERTIATTATGAWRRERVIVHTNGYDDAR